MQSNLAALTIGLMMGLVVARSLLLSGQGIKTIHFGNLDRKDFLIPPFALFLFYTIFANALNWPAVSTQRLFQSDAIAWVGVCLCLAGVLLFLWSLISFGQSFRVGIDTDNPDKLVQTGAFAFTRNPIYVAFGLVLLGEFLVFPNWILLAYLAGGSWLVHRQVLREEAYLKQHYGREYSEYASRVRRYI